MKNNKKYTLIIFIVVLFMVLFITGVPESLIYKVSAAEKYNDIHEEYEDMYQNINMKNAYEGKQSHLNKKVNEINLDKEILQENIINTLWNIAKNNDILLESIVFGEIVPAFKEGENNSKCMNVKVNFSCDYNNMLSFIDAVKNFRTDISFFSISILTVSDNLVNVTAELIFYALPFEVEVGV